MCSKVKFCFLELSEAFFFFFQKNIFNLQLVESVGAEPLDVEAACITFTNVSLAKAGHVAKRRGQPCQSSDCRGRPARMGLLCD